MWLVLRFNLTLIGALVGVDVVAHSLGFMAEGADYLADAPESALRSSPSLFRRDNSGSARGADPNVTKEVALVNGGWLSIPTILVIAGATNRIARGPRPVQGLSGFIVSGAAALVMLIGALILGGVASPTE